MPPAPWLKAIRSSIDENGQQLLDIINEPHFKKYFGQMEGEKLKTAPRDYLPDHPHIDLLRNKSFLAMHRVDENTVLSETYVEYCANIFEALKPFDDFLNNALRK